MSVEVKGVKQLIAELEKRFGKAKMQQVSDNALLAGAKVFVAELESQFTSFKDTGASIEEITISDPFYRGSERVVAVHWKGSKGRYRIIHLNEFGTVKNPNPAGKGAIARTMRNAESAYLEAIKQAIQEGI